MRVKLKYFILLLYVAMWQFSVAQNSVCALSIKGKVADMNTSGALGEVTIAVAETQQATFTDEAGKFQLNNLCKGKITISVSHIG